MGTSSADLKEKLQLLRARVEKKIMASSGSKERTVQNDADKENSLFSGVAQNDTACSAPVPVGRTTACCSAHVLSNMPSVHSSSSRRQDNAVEKVARSEDLAGGDKVANSRRRERDASSQDPRPQSCEPAVAGYSAASNRSRSLVGGKTTVTTTINRRSYTVLGLLGRGGSSKVYEVLDDAEKKCKALKIVDLSNSGDDVREAYQNEIRLLTKLIDSGCVIRLFDYELRSNSLHMVMEKGEVDLATFLKTRRQGIDEIFIRFYWREMLKCVKVIHDEGIVHSDLKPANFLIVGGSLKLIDFGIASAIPADMTSVAKDSLVGTLSYMSPESLSGISTGGKEVFKVKKKGDVWSLGCILYNMVYGRTPFQQFRNSAQKMNAIINSPVPFDPIDDPDLLDVMERCLVKDPNERASVEELLNHRYLKKKSTVELVSSDESFAENDSIMKLVQDLRNCTPRTSARKLRSLMAKNSDTVGNQ